MKITIADLKKQLKLQNEKLAFCKTVEEAQAVLKVMSSISETINRAFEEVTVSFEAEEKVVTLKKFLQQLRQKEREKQVLSELVLDDEQLAQQQEAVLALATTIQNEWIAYNRFIYSTEFEVESGT